MILTRRVYPRMFFIYKKKSENTLRSKGKCEVCSGKIDLPFNPMKEWGIDGAMCGKCYSKKLNEHYPGDHTRVNKHLD